MWNACPGPWICRTTKNSLAAWAMQQRHTYCQLVPHHWRPHAPFADLFCIIYLMPKSALQSKVHTTMPSVSLHGLAVALSAKPLEPQPVIFPAKTQLCFPRAKTNELRSAPQPKTVLNACGNGGGENACVCVHTHTHTCVKVYYLTCRLGGWSEFSFPSDPTTPFTSAAARPEVQWGQGNAHWRPGSQPCRSHSPPLALVT